jgi:hypothetical protein
MPASGSYRTELSKEAALAENAANGRSEVFERAC